MLSRALYLSAGWFAISLITTLIWGKRLQKGNLFISLGWLSVVTFMGDAWAILTFGVPGEIFFMSGVMFLFTLFWIAWLRDWNALGQVTWASTILTTILFIIYAFSVTAFSPINPISFLLAIVFFFIEAIALIMALTHTYESLDVACRIRWHRRFGLPEPQPDFTPKVSLHVATYNEPVEVVAKTLRSLAQLDYPDYEVLVVDNNTPDEATWRPLANICQDLGPNFHLLHLDKWPGFKAGALNFSLAQTAPDAEFIATIDADYQLQPNFLRDLIPAFLDPSVAFIQTPQDYFDYQGDTFSEATYYGYKYFFEVSMPVRNEHNAIIFAGTMGLIRKSVLEEIGGWDEWCITEDAETSLRILKRGYQSLYINKTYGHGLMPFNFESLKKQRFRWCFGGIQILKKHWEALMPWAHWVDPSNKLTFAQRYFYLVGGLQWFTDVLNLLFALFLMLGAVLSMVSSPLQVRPLTAPLMIMPAIFLFLHMWRFVWVLRHKLRLSFGMSLKTMYNFFSLGWAVTLACIQGLIQEEGVFLRTPKSKSGSRIWQAIRVTQWESLIGLSCFSIGAVAYVTHPNLRTLFLGGLLVWQSSLYFAAPAFSLLNAREDLRAYRSEHGTPVVESRAARWAMGLALMIVVVTGITQLLPSPKNQPKYAQFQPVDVPPKRLVGIERVPIEERATPPTPTETGIPTPTPTNPILLPTAVITGTATPTNSPATTPLPATATPTPTVAGGGPTITPSSPTPASGSPTPFPSATAIGTVTTPTQIGPTATVSGPTPTPSPVIGLPGTATLPAVSTPTPPLTTTQPITITPIPTVVP